MESFVSLDPSTSCAIFTPENDQSTEDFYAEIPFLSGDTRRANFILLF
jgi:hypothetical protein